MSPQICVVIANYYPEISDKLIDGSNKELKKYGIKINNKIHVPGIFEIPVVIAKKIDKYDGFIALGCVIKGKTPHYNLISKATTNALMKLFVLPIILNLYGFIDLNIIVSPILYRHKPPLVLITIAYILFFSTSSNGIIFSSFV